MDSASKIIEKVLSGDLQAFEQLYNNTITKVYRTLYFLCGADRSDLEDIVQNVYLELFRHLDKFNRDRSFEAWVSGIAVRQLQAHRRRKWKQRRKEERLLFAENGRRNFHVSAQMNDDLLNLEALMKDLEALSDKLRQVIILHYVNELTHQEIADLLHIPVGTVKSRLHLALAQLRRKMRREDNAR